MGIGMSELLIIMVIVILVFGTKRLKNVGSDLGDAIKNFRGAMKDGNQEKSAAENTAEKQPPEATKDDQDQV